MLIPILRSALDIKPNTNSGTKTNGIANKNFKKSSSDTGFPLAN